MTNPGIPHSREAEEAVIGSVLIYPDLVDRLGLLPEDFYIHRLRWIWETFQRLRETNAPIDILTVSRDLEQHGFLSEIGGPAFLTALLNQVPTTLNAEAYVDIVKSASLRRQLLTSINEIARLVYDETLAASEVIEHAEVSIRSLANRAGEDTDIEDAADVGSRIYDRAAERYRISMSETSESDGVQVGNRVPTGLEDLDNLLKGGLRPGAMIVVAGRPGEGKSSLLLTIAAYAVQVGKRVLSFGLEMSNDETMSRYLSSRTGLDANQIAEGVLAGNQWGPFTEALDGVPRGMLFLYGKSALTPLFLRAKCSRVKSRYGLDLIIIDYIQLMRSGARSLNREQEVANISRELKILAGDLNVPVLVAAQLSRAVEQREGKEPQLYDLRESGAIENDADVVMFVYRPADPNNRNTCIKIAKHRGGPVGGTELYFNKRLTRFQKAVSQSKPTGKQ